MYLYDYVITCIYMIMWLHVFIWLCDYMYLYHYVCAQSLEMFNKRLMICSFFHIYVFILNVYVYIIIFLEKCIIMHNEI